MSPFVGVRAFLVVVVNAASLIGLLVITTASSAISSILELLLISGTPEFVLSKLSAYIVFVTRKSFSTSKSLLIVTAGVITIPLLSSVSITLDDSVKLPIESPPPAAAGAQRVLL